MSAEPANKPHIIRLGGAVWWARMLIELTAHETPEWSKRWMKVHGIGPTPSAALADLIRRVIHVC